MPKNNTSEEKGTALRSGRILKCRSRLRCDRRVPSRRVNITLSRMASPTTEEVVTAATTAVAAQMTNIFESFLGQLRTDLQQLNVAGSAEAVKCDQETPTRKTEEDEKLCKDIPAENATSSQGTTSPLNRADDWIDDFLTLPEPVASHRAQGPSALLQQLPPAIAIEPFDGDPRKWDQFIGSFKALVHDVVSSDAQRIAILRQLLSPRLRASIAPSLYGPALYGQALADLRRLFGDPNLVIDAYIKTLMDIAPMKPGDSIDVDRFFYEVHGAVNTLRTRGATSELSSRTTLHAVVSKLNKKMQSMWARRVYELRPRPADLCDLDVWLEEIVSIQNNVHYEWRECSERQARKPRPKEPRHCLNVSITNDTLKKCPLCDKEHSLVKCPAFTSYSAQQRAEVLKQHGRCFACFEPNHQARKCKQRRVCGVHDCRLRHHPLLHGASRVFPTRSAESVLSKESAIHVGSNSITPPATEVLLSVVRASLTTKDNVSMEVNVLLDPGSEATLIREDIAYKVGLKGTVENVRLGTFHGIDPLFRCRRVSFMLHSLDQRHKFEVDGALTVPTLNLTHRRVDFEGLRNNWPHLRGIDIIQAQHDDVSVLVGMDVVGAHEQFRILKSPMNINAPRAVQTPFGWCVIGRVSSNFRSPSLSPNSRLVCRITLNRQGEELAVLVQHQWSIESLGISQPHKEKLSPEDEKAMEILQSSTRRVNGRYECAMLWKTARKEMQDSLHTANARFEGLERRFRRNPDFARRYADVIDEYLRMGYAKQVPLVNDPCDCWFLPHHAVESPSKPGKTRIVFDASARSNGISLNDMLLTGPDMLTDLFGLLLRFREYPVPVSADIAKMFHQVLVPERDQMMLPFRYEHLMKHFCNVCRHGHRILSKAE
uniref:Peptidase A2 domain-containing protein n=1 Tax=Trichuris muris TaxID=70415 RepID=A0A5S6QHU9_TRIMR